MASRNVLLCGCLWCSLESLCKMCSVLKDEQMLVTDHYILYSQHCIFTTWRICSGGELIAWGSTNSQDASLGWAEMGLESFIYFLQSQRKILIFLLPNNALDNWSSPFNYVSSHSSCDMCLSPRRFLVDNLKKLKLNSSMKTYKTF